jgi:hypothetical protein
MAQSIVVLFYPVLSIRVFLFVILAAIVSEELMIVVYMRRSLRPLGGGLQAWNQAQHKHSYILSGFLTLRISRLLSTGTGHLSRFRSKMAFCTHGFCEVKLPEGTVDIAVRRRSNSLLQLPAPSFVMALLRLTDQHHYERIYCVLGGLQENPS